MSDNLPPPPVIPVEMKRLMFPMAYRAYTATLIGGAPAATRAMYERMKRPQPGDLVIEVSTCPRLMRAEADPNDPTWDGQFVTYVGSEVRTTAYNDDEGGAEWSEEVHVCLNPDGTTFEWTNASIVAVPTDMQFGTIEKALP